jgi:hypothetical protein
VSPKGKQKKRNKRKKKGKKPEPPKHRGRLQAQGNDINEPAPSFPWARAMPLPKVTALAGLDKIKGECTASQAKLRERAFQKAQNFIRGGPYEALPDPIFRSFYGDNLPERCRNARVDVEIRLGKAFV